MESGDEDHDFEGWNTTQGYNYLNSQHAVIILMFIPSCSSTFKSPENQKVLEKLLVEVKGLNPSFDTGDIRSKLYQLMLLKSMMWLLLFQVLPIVSFAPVVKSNHSKDGAKPMRKR